MILGSDLAVPGESFGDLTCPRYCRRQVLKVHEISHNVDIEINGHKHFILNRTLMELSRKGRSRLLLLPRDSMIIIPGTRRDGFWAGRRTTSKTPAPPNRHLIPLRFRIPKKESIFQ
jgi:hypothetical protein